MRTALIIGGTPGFGGTVIIARVNRLGAALQQ